MPTAARAERVSVRLECEGEPALFGVARVTNTSFGHGDAVDLELIGEGPLAKMAKA